MWLQNSAAEPNAIVLGQCVGCGLFSINCIILVSLLSAHSNNYHLLIPIEVSMCVLNRRNRKWVFFFSSNACFLLNGSCFFHYKRGLKVKHLEENENADCFSRCDFSCKFITGISW